METLKGYVNAWDCDENDHLNVQFYYRFFEDACCHFQALAGVSRDDFRRPLVRHVRYHGELRKNEAVQVDSVRAGEAQIVHVLSEPVSGRLSATCLETFAGPLPDALPSGSGAIPENALPRSLDSAPAAATAATASDRLVLRTRIRAQHCDPSGAVFDSAIVGFNSDSAAFFWEAVGITEPWLRERNRGRVAVEMKLTRLGDAAFGDLIHVISRPIAVARSTVTFENRFVRSETGETVAVVQVTGLTMDLTARRAQPLPEDLRADLEARIARSR
ncbi:thioesterase family protein [Microbaculum marinum]|uniref:Thioesterase family protein n=1 Tax=Microbaculum marinum TaxID=1764581 RepID=A0AAW9RGG4_9HYPH